MAWTITLEWAQSVPLAFRGGADGYFGGSVALTASRAIVGCCGKNANDGAVYVYSIDGTYLLTLLPQLPIDAGSYFGASISASGDWLIVGVPGNDVIYFYEWTGATYTFRQRLTGSTTLGGDWFGTTVTMDSTFAVVGAFEDAGNNAGNIFVFTLTADVWGETQHIQAPVTATSDQFGVSVALDATSGVLVVGAAMTGGDAGQVFIFEEAAGVFAQAGEFDAPQAGDALGSSVAVSGTTVAVGAPYRNGTFLSCGAVEIYNKGGGIWGHSQTLLITPETTEDDGMAGAIGDLGVTEGSVAIMGDLLVVGSPGWRDDGGVTWKGATFLFVREAGVWAQQPVYMYPNSAGLLGHGQFGVSCTEGLSSAGDYLLVGAFAEGAVDDPTYFGGNARLYALGLLNLPMKLPMAGLYIDEVRGIKHT